MPTVSYCSNPNGQQCLQGFCEKQTYITGYMNTTNKVYLLQYNITMRMINNKKPQKIVAAIQFAWNGLKLRGEFTLPAFIVLVIAIAVIYYLKY